MTSAASITARYSAPIIYGGSVSICYRPCYVCMSTLCLPPRKFLLMRCACAGGVKLLRRQHHGPAHHWRHGVPAAGPGAGALAVQPPSAPCGGEPPALSGW